MMLLYLAGPYRGAVQENIARARRIAVEVWEAGHVALCPHLNTAHFDVLCTGVPDDAFLRGDCLLIRAVAAVGGGMLMLPSWRSSAGALDEFGLARRLDMRIWEYGRVDIRVIPAAECIAPSVHVTRAHHGGLA